ncbi:MAG: hypothetical protein ACYC6Y_32060 [Thermoguttaceae bacterium]
MNNAERVPFGLLRGTGILLSLLAWGAFFASFFLPAADQIGSMPGAPLGPQSGWQTFVDSLLLSTTAAGWAWQPLTLLCLLSPVPNGLMLLAVPANLALKQYAACVGALLFLTAVSAFWVCWQVYEGLALGFYLWIGSILAMALASFLIGASWVVEDNRDYQLALAQLQPANIPPL